MFHSLAKAQWHVGIISAFSVGVENRLDSDCSLRSGVALYLHYTQQNCLH